MEALWSRLGPPDTSKRPISCLKATQDADEGRALDESGIGDGAAQAIHDRIADDAGVTMMLV